MHGTVLPCLKACCLSNCTNVMDLHIVGDIATCFSLLDMEQLPDHLSSR